MGIPGYFRQIVSQYPTIVEFSPSVPIDHVLWDFNGILYECYENVNVKNKTLLKAKFEKALLDCIEKRIKEMCASYTPTKTFFIAVDGVVPLHKMAEQRTRRYMKKLDSEWIPLLLEKPPLKDKDTTALFVREKETVPIFSRQNFTPGSPFYVSLQKTLETVLYSLSQTPEYKHITFLLDGPFQQGEAEMKLLYWVKTAKTHISTNDNFFIISDDADLLTQPLRLAPLKFYILRHHSKLPYGWLDTYKQANPDARNIKTLPLYVILPLHNISAKSFEILRSQYPEFKHVHEYMYAEIMFLTFFQGNDFVKPFWFLPSNQEDSLKLLLQIYGKVFCTKQNHNRENSKNKKLLILPTKLNPNVSISLKSLRALLEQLSAIEYDKIIEQLEKILHSASKYKQHKNPQDNDTELPTFFHWFEHLPFIHPDHPFQHEYREQVETLLQVMRKNRTRPDIWKTEFYKLFDVKMSYKFVHEYLLSLSWNIKYYFDYKPPHWGWSNTFDIAPLPSDIVAWINAEINTKPYANLERYDRLDTWIIWNQVESQLPNIPMTPLLNWLMVLPPYPDWLSGLEDKDAQVPTEIVKTYKTAMEKKNTRNNRLSESEVEKHVIPVVLLTGHKWIAKNLTPFMPPWEVEWIFYHFPKKLSAKTVERNVKIPLLQYTFQ